MPVTKSMTLRLQEDRARELEAVARADGVAISDAIRDAIDRHIAERRKDSAFQDRIKRMMEDNREILERLAT